MLDPYIERERLESERVSQTMWKNPQLDVRFGREFYILYETLILEEGCEQRIGDVKRKA